MSPRIHPKSFALLALAFAACHAPAPEPSYHATDIQPQVVPMVMGSYQGARVACIPYVNKSLSVYRTLGDASVGILPEYLLEAGFQPIEASEGGELGAALAELEYDQSGRVDVATAAAVGKHLGARYVFVGEVNNYREVKTKGSRAIGLMGYQISGGGAAIVYDLQVSGRLIDVETRAIVAAKTIAHNESFDLDGGSISTPFGSFNQSEEIEVKQDATGKVLHHAFNRLVGQIVQQLNARG